MNCKTCRDEIEELESGQPLSQSVITHFESCRNCLSFRDERLALNEMIGRLQVVEAPPDFDFRLRARLAALKSQKPKGVVWGRLAPSGWSLAFVSSIVILVGLGIVLNQIRRVPQVRSEPNVITTRGPSDGIIPGDTASGPGTSLNKERGVIESARVNLLSASVSKRRGASTSRDNAKVLTNVSDDNSSEEGSSVDSSVSPATNVLPPGISDPTLIRRVMTIPLGVSPKPITIEVNDGGEKRQRISLRPVTFGGQDVIEQTSVKTAFVPMTQGIW